MDESYIGPRPDAEETKVDKIEMRPPVEGKHSRVTFLTKPELKGGYVDAPHAQELTVEVLETQMEKLVYTGQIFTREGFKKPAKSKIYLNARMRRFFGVETDGVLKIGNVMLTVAQGRRRSEGGRPEAIVIDSSNKIALAQEIKKRSSSDQYTRQIADNFSNQGGSAIVGTTNRSICDINRYPDFGDGLDPGSQEEGVKEYRIHKKRVLENSGNMGEQGEALKPFLHVAIHGKKNFDGNKHGDSDIEVGTARGSSCSDSEVVNWFTSRMQEKMRERGVVINPSLNRNDDRSDNSPIVKNDVRLWGHASKDEGRKTHGDNFMTIQLEISRQLRQKYQQEIADILTEIIEEFTEKYHK